MAKPDATGSEIVESTQVGSLTFEQENEEWSLLPAPTPPASHAITLLNEGFSTPERTPCTGPTVSDLANYSGFFIFFLSIHD